MKNCFFLPLSFTNCLLLVLKFKSQINLSGILSFWHQLVRLLDCWVLYLSVSVWLESNSTLQVFPRKRTIGFSVKPNLVYPFVYSTLVPWMGPFSSDSLAGTFARIRTWAHDSSKLLSMSDRTSWRKRRREVDGVEVRHRRRRRVALQQLGGERKSRKKWIKVISVFLLFLRR